MKTHNPEINPGYLVRHSLRMRRCDPQEAQMARTELEQLPGMDQVIFDPSTRTLRIAYDGSRHKIDELLEIAGQHGLRPRKGLWTRVRLGMARNVDQNVWDNAGYHPTCCNKPPQE